jgi:uncharacterized protein
MDFLIITAVSFFIAALTLVSGFGLGTVLLPAFALFFPLEVAIAATALVHLANNIFKIALVGRWASRAVTIRFGVPAVLAAFIGAAIMTLMADSPPLHEYAIGRVQAQVTWLKLVIGVLLATFAALELWPRYHTFAFPPRALPIGGIASGFFGGLSGMQGALRAPFLIRAGLTREQYVGTAAVISTIVDVARLAVYAIGFTWLAQRTDYRILSEPHTLRLVAAACIAGFLGSYLGAKVVKKVTLRGIQQLVALMLFIAAVALAGGLV